MAFWTIVYVGIILLQVGWSAYQWYSAKGESARAAGFDAGSLPRANEGDAVSLVYGQVRIRAPQIVAFAETTGSPELLDGVGLQYIVSANFVLCLSNDRIATPGTHRGVPISWMIGDREVGGFTLSTATQPEGHTKWDVDDSNILGGNVLGGGGRVKGGYTFYDGNWNQGFWGADPGADTNNSPNYRGFVGVRLSAMYVGLSPQLPAYSFVVYNPITIPGYESVSGPMANNQANPAAVLYDLLTNEWGRVGFPASVVDAAGFAAAATTLRDEQHGCSVLVARPNDARSVIEQILKQIDATLYEDPATRQLKLELVRENYDPNTIPVFDMSNILGDPRMSSTLYEETVNEVRVIYTSTVNGYTEAVALAQDLGVINAQGGRRKTAELRFPWVANQQTAYELAQRELNFLSRPIATLKIKVNREGFDLRPGQPFRFTYSEWGYTNVFRVVDLDYGTLTDGAITVNAVQDRFSIQGTTFDPPDDEIGPTPPTADPIRVRTVTEAPRWIMLKAYEQGSISNVDAQRGFFLAKPEGSDSLYKVTGAVDVSLEEELLSGRTFPGGATVETQYSRTTSAYDVTTHLRIQGLYGVTLATATQTQIATEGRNLLQVGGELMAFESATDLGGGVWRLNNVWRGVLDTVPATHAVGAQVYFLAGSYAGAAMGRRVFPHGSTVVAHTQGGAGSLWIPSGDSPEDTLVARSRTLLPYPPSDLKLQATKTPAAIEEGGVTVEWRTRDRLQGGITRPDATAETPEAGTNHNVIASKGTAADVELALAHVSSATVQVPLGPAGHGTLEVGARSYRTVTLPGGTAASLSSWQRPKLDILAHHWRNLLRNPRFVTNLDYWDAVTGTAVRATTLPLGGLGGYITSSVGVGNPGVTEVKQDVIVSGYLPKNYAAVLDFFTKNTGDAGDTITVELRTLNSVGTTLQTSTYGPVDPGTDWLSQSLTIADLHDDTFSIRVRVVMTATGEIDGQANVAFTEVCLRVGQVSSQLLVNPSFEAGIAVGWTASVGAWQVLTTTKYDLTNYARPQDLASAQLRQAVTLPAGFETGVALLESARMSDDVDDTGTVTLEALDGAGAVVGSVTTGAQALTPLNVWQRRRLVLDPIPSTATQLRVTLDAARVTGVPLNTCFDAFDLRCHKHLDPDEETTLFSSLSFVEQPLPTTITDWKQHFPTVPAPDYAIYDGGLVGRLGIEPTLEAGTGCFASGKAVVAGPELDVTTCYESTGTSTVVDADIHTAPVGDAFANFSTEEPFTVLAFWKCDGPLASAQGITGRIIGTAPGRGWSLELLSSGRVRARVRDGVSTYSADGFIQETDDGALHGGALIYNPTTDLLHVVDGTGNYNVSTAGMGEIRATTPGKFRIMATGEAGLQRLAGQVPRVYIWRGARTTAEMAAVLKYAAKPFSALTSWARTGTVACVTGSDSTGVLVEKFGPDRAALAKDTTSGRIGLVGMPAIVNANANPFTSTSFGQWEHSGNVTLAAAADPTGQVVAARVVGGSSDPFTANNLTLGAAGTRHIHFFARADDSHTMLVELEDSDDPGVPLVTQTFVVNPQWQLFTWSPAWTGGIGGIGKVDFLASNDGTSRTIYLSPLVLVTGGALAPWPGTMPIGSPGATLPICTAAPSAQFNREGEIEVESVHTATGTIAMAHNNTNNNDKRTIRWEAGDTMASDHYTSAAVNDTTATMASAFGSLLARKHRLRWNRASCLDGISSVFVMLRGEVSGTVEQDGGRAAVWTASSTPLTRLNLLNDGSSGVAGLVFNARISAREKKV